MSQNKGPEIKGIDQIFPKKAEEVSGSASLKLWAAAGVVAMFAAGYALFPSPGGNAAASTAKAASKSVVAAPASALSLPNAKPEMPEATAKKPVPAAVEDVKTARKQEAKRQQQQQKTEVSQNSGSSAPEVKAATKVLAGRSCDCDTAELSLPAQCPDLSCRQCKASCGIPGN